MASNTPYLVREQPPKALIYLLLMVGLAAITYAIIAQKLLIAIAIVCLPIVIIAVAYGFQIHISFIYYMLLMPFSSRQSLVILLKSS